MKAQEHLLAAGVCLGANQQRREPSFPTDGAKFFPNDTRPPHEWMPRSFQRRLGGGSVQRCFNPHSVGSHLPDAGDGDVGAGCDGGATDAVAPFASFEATCGPTTFSARGGSESLPGAHTPNQWSETDWMAPVVEKRRAKRRKAPPSRRKRGFRASPVGGAGDGIRTHDLLHGKQML